MNPIRDSVSSIIGEITQRAYYNDAVIEIDKLKVLYEGNEGLFSSQFDFLMSNGWEGDIDDLRRNAKRLRAVMEAEDTKRTFPSENLIEGVDTRLSRSISLTRIECRN